MIRYGLDFNTTAKILNNTLDKEGIETSSHIFHGELIWILAEKRHNDLAVIDHYNKDDLEVQRYTTKINNKMRNLLKNDFKLVTNCKFIEIDLIPLTIEAFISVYDEVKYKIKCDTEDIELEKVVKLVKAIK